MSVWIRSWTLSRSGPCSENEATRSGSAEDKQRRAERGRHRAARRARGPRRRFVRRRVENLTARSHRRPAARHLDANRMRLTVAIARIRFHRQLVVAGELRLDAREQRLARTGTVKSVPRDAPASMSSPSVAARRSANGFRAMRASARRKAPDRAAARTGGARRRRQTAELDQVVDRSLNVNPSEMKISVLGASMARKPMNRSRSAWTVWSASCLASSVI